MLGHARTCDACAVVLYDVVWYDMVCYYMIWYVVPCYVMIWCVVTWYDMMWHMCYDTCYMVLLYAITWYAMLYCSYVYIYIYIERERDYLYDYICYMVWCDMIWCDMILYGVMQCNVQCYVGARNVSGCLLTLEGQKCRKWFIVLGSSLDPTLG